MDGARGERGLAEDRMKVGAVGLHARERVAASAARELGDAPRRGSAPRAMSLAIIGS